MPPPRPIAEALAEGGGWLVPDRVAELLAAYGVPQVAATVAATPAAVGRCAAELGGPVAIKAIAPGLLHKSDVGGVRLGMHGAAAAGRRGARDRRRRTRGRPPAGRLPRAGDGAGGRRDARRRRLGPGLGARRGVRRRRHARSSCSATSSRDWRRSAGRRRARCSARCAPSRCSTATAASRAPTSRRSRTSSSASRRSPPRTPRSPSSTATRCSWGPAAPPWSTPACGSRRRRRAAVPVAGPLNAPVRRRSRRSARA